MFSSRAVQPLPQVIECLLCESMFPPPVVPQRGPEGAQRNARVVACFDESESRGTAAVPLRC